MKVDAHHHLWTISRGDYGWLTPALGPIYRDFTMDDMSPLLDATGIDRTIVVQAADTVRETEFLLSQAEGSDRVAGVVGWIDMQAPDAIARRWFAPHAHGKANAVAQPPHPAYPRHQHPVWAQLFWEVPHA